MLRMQGTNRAPNEMRNSAEGPSIGWIWGCVCIACPVVCFAMISSAIKAPVMPRLCEE